MLFCFLLFLFSTQRNISFDFSVKNLIKLIDIAQLQHPMIAVFRDYHLVPIFYL